MSENSTITQNDISNASNATNSEPAAPAFTLDDIKRKYFSPSEIATEGNAELQRVMSIPNVKRVIVQNFEGTELPAGYGIGIIPIAKRTEGKGNIVSGVGIFAIPDYDLVANHPDGNKFIRDTVQAQFLAKAATAIRPRKDGEAAQSVPFKLEDFLSRDRGAPAQFKSFTQLAPEFVAALKERGIKHMNKDYLRQILMSADFAKTQFPKIKQSDWEKVLHAMIAIATKQSLDVSTFEKWLAERNETSAQSAEEIDFSDFDKMLGEDEDAEDDAA